MSIEIKSINGKTFKLGGTSYAKGSVIAIYESNNVDPATGVVYTNREPRVKFQFTNGETIDASFIPYTKYVDGNGDEFASFDAFSMAVAGILAPSTATDVSVLTVDGLEPDEAGNVSSKLISDKGTVTQATSITTGVTLSKLNGVITTFSSTLAAGAETKFTVTNTAVAATSNIQVSVIYPDTAAGFPVATVNSIGSGSFIIRLKNVHASAALDAAVKIAFVVL